MTKDELLKEAMELLRKAYNDAKTELKIRLAIPKLAREYERILTEKL
jgi:hypothetical protein